MNNTAPYQEHSATSRAAAAEIRPSAASLRAKVYDAIVRSGSAGMTDEEIQIALTMPGSTERPRRVELVRSGLVVALTEGRKTMSGRLATVWIALS